MKIETVFDLGEKIKLDSYFGIFDTEIEEINISSRGIRYKMSKSSYYDEKELIELIKENGFLNPLLFTKVKLLS